MKRKVRATVLVRCCGRVGKFGGMRSEGKER